MNASFKKSINDLRINPGRSALVLFALIIGLWGVGSTLTSFTVMKNDLNANFTGTIPAHVIMTSDNFDRLDLTEFRVRPEIEGAELRDLSIQRIEVFPDTWIPLWIYGVEDFSHFHLARVYPQEGSRVPPPGSILVERDGFPTDKLHERISNFRIGSAPRIRAGGRILTASISGMAFDPAQAPATQDAFIYAYTDKKTYSQITGEASNRRLIFRLKNMSSKKEIESAAKRIMADFEARGIAIKTTEIPKFNEHPHQFQLNTLLMINIIIGVLAFIMGAVMVSQLMSALLAQQVRQIGILKAIGASRFQVLKIYLVMVILLGAATTLIAIPLAVSSGYAYARFVAKIINFDILTTSLPTHLYVYMIATGLLLPIILSLPALLRGVKVSVHEAISDYGIRQNGRSSGPGFLSSLQLSNSLKLALRNTMRRKKRLAVTVATMALGVSIFSTGFNVRQSLVVFLNSSRNAMKYDVQVVLKDPIPIERAMAPFRSLDNVARVEPWNGGKGRLQTGIVSTGQGIGIVALPWNTDLMQWKITEGRWLKPSGDVEIVMNQQAIEAFGMPSVGSVYPIDIKGRMIRAKLVGRVKEFDAAKIYIDQKRYDSLVNPDHMRNSMMFVAKDNGYDQIISLKKEIEHAIAESDLNIMYVMSQAERARIIYDHLNIILTVLTLLALLVLVVSALGMAAATGINIMERRREIGVMRAIGATPKLIYGLFVTEGVVVSIVSILIGVFLSLPMSFAASAFFGSLILGASTPLDFAFSISGFVITLLTTMAFGWLASRIPARGAIRVSTREALAYE